MRKLEVGDKVATGIVTVGVLGHEGLREREHALSYTARKLEEKRGALGDVVMVMVPADAGVASEEAIMRALKVETK